VADEASEKGHQASVTRPLGVDRSRLVEHPSGAVPLEDDGRVFGGDYTFRLKSEPLERHRLQVRVHTGRNVQGLTLSLRRKGQWLQMGTRTRNVPGPGRWMTLWFDLPAAAFEGPETEFKLSAKGVPEVNAYRLWLARLGPDPGRPLAERLGYPLHQRLGEVDKGLRPHGEGWSMPLALSSDPQVGVLLIRNVGEGVLVKTELPLDTCRNLFQVLLSPEKTADLRRALAGP
jgi:hypothetical protein